MTRFALIGAAGYVAERHFQAIRDLGHELAAVLDPHDSVGILDRYAPGCSYFSSLWAFDRYLVAEGRAGRPVEWLSICTPNYLHESMVRWGLRSDMNVICEKPLALEPRNLDEIAYEEEISGRRAYCILQLRQAAEMIALRDANLSGVSGEVHYWSPRGPWYDYSWKGDEAKSGGLLFNIGVHYLDLAIWLFGKVEYMDIRVADADRWDGRFEHERGNRFDWTIAKLEPYRRETIIDGEVIEFAHFASSDLHTDCYRAILEGRGTGVEDCRPSIELISAMRAGGVTV